MPQLGPFPRNERAHWQSPGDVRLISVRRFHCVLAGFAATWTPSTKRACSLAVPGRCAADLGAAISLRSGGVYRNVDPFHETSVLTGSPRAMCRCFRCGDFTFWLGLPQLRPLPRNEHAHWQSAGDVQLLSVRRFHFVLVLRFHCVLVGFAATWPRNKNAFHETSVIAGSPREMSGCSR